MNANDLFKAVMELDLTPIKTKLMHVESGEGWSLEKTNAVEKEYRRFLCLMKLFHEEDTAPLVDVDIFWHYHILDTMKYAVDCEQVFGYFLHHYPYVGMGGSQDDEQFRLDSGDRMRDLYEATFGDAYPDSFDEAVQASAYCAGPAPHKPVGGIYLGAGFGAGARVTAPTAYCAGPAPHEQDRGIRLGAGTAAKTAYCAGPAPHVKATNTAYCAGPAPHIKAAKTAYCAGPAPHIKAAKTAYCAGPAPHKQVRGIQLGAVSASGTGKAANTAYCAGPAPHGTAAKTAYCAGPAPHKQVHGASASGLKALAMA